jgi:NAD(P)-dependent dehydrogenase (short-subunit alcohol dehydrogenase family)
VRASADRIASKTGRSHEDAMAEFAKAPIGRLIRPQEVAAAALYLCQPDAAAVTGATLTVAGGEL